MPKATNTKATAAAIPEKIETPLVCVSGDTTPVSAALGFLATALRSTDPGDDLALSYSDCYGLSILLDTCASALDAMNRPDWTEGGAV